MCKKHASIQLIYGDNGSGKSQLVRELMKRRGSYLFNFNDYFSQNYVDREKVEDMFKNLTGKSLSDITSPSYSQKNILMFCYELEAIMEMQEPYSKLFIDELPFEVDKSTMNNFLELFSYLSDLDFKVTFTTCKKYVKDLFTEYFKDSPDFKLVEL